MKQIFLFCSLVFLSSCSDGDIAIETIDFDSATIAYCDNPSTTSTRIFFKINQNNEALILDLQSGLLKNEVSTEPIKSSVPSQSKITYRIFSDKVAKEYFCDAIPHTEPTVTEEIIAEGGEVIISTTKNAEGDFEHTISLSGISLVTESGTRITDLRITNYGTVITKN
ncbi:MAG: hypothetical protein V3U92_19195 [Cellulophaga sp.]